MISIVEALVVFDTTKIPPLLQNPLDKTSDQTTCTFVTITDDSVLSFNFKQYDTIIVAKRPIQIEFVGTIATLASGTHFLPGWMTMVYKIKLLECDGVTVFTHLFELDPESYYTAIMKHPIVVPNIYIEKLIDTYRGDNWPSYDSFVAEYPSLSDKVSEFLRPTKLPLLIFDMPTYTFSGYQLDKLCERYRQEEVLSTKYLACMQTGAKYYDNAHNLTDTKYNTMIELATSRGYRLIPKSALTIKTDWLDRMIGPDGLMLKVSSL